MKVVPLDGLYNAARYEFTLGPIGRLLVTPIRFLGIRILGSHDSEAAHFDDFEFDSWFNAPNLIRSTGALEMILLHEGKAPVGWREILDCSNPLLLNEASEALKGLARQRGHQVVIFNRANVGGPFASAPTLLYLGDSGEACALWDPPNNSGGCVAIWFTDGVACKRLESIHGYCYETDHYVPNLPLNDVLAWMQHSLCRTEDHFCDLFQSTLYRPETHAIFIAKENSIVIYSQRTRLIDNPFGPAVITAHGYPMHFRRGWRIRPPKRTCRKNKLTTLKSAISKDFPKASNAAAHRSLTLLEKSLNAIHDESRLSQTIFRYGNTTSFTSESV